MSVFSPTGNLLQSFSISPAQWNPQLSAFYPKIPVSSSLNAAEPQTGTEPVCNAVKVQSVCAIRFPENMKSSSV